MTETLHSIEETMAVASKLARSLRAGDVIALTGDLGAGKTHFSKGLVAGLGSPDDVTSPTFTLVHEYHAGRLPVYHFDFYRLDDPSELIAIGWDEYLDAGGVVIVEWADKHPQLLPPGAQWWRLRVTGENARSLERLE